MKNLFTLVCLFFCCTVGVKAQNSLQPFLDLGNKVLNLDPDSDEARFFAYRLFSAHQWLKENRQQVQWTDKKADLLVLQNQLLSGANVSKKWKNIVQVLSGNMIYNLYVIGPVPQSTGAGVDINFSTMDPLQRAFAFMNIIQREKFKESLDSFTKQKFELLEQQNSFQELSKELSRDMSFELNLGLTQEAIRGLDLNSLPTSDKKVFKKINKQIEKLQRSGALEKMKEGGLGGVNN